MLILNLLSLFADTEIILIADPRVLAIPIKENNEELVDIKNQNKIAFKPIKDVPEVLNAFTKMRKTVYNKLLKAQILLPKGMKFLLTEGFRDPKYQAHIFKRRYEKNKKDFPHLTEEELYQKTISLVSPIRMLNGEKNAPPHCTGAAIDVFLVDDNGNILDMGMDPFEEFYNPDLCYTNAKNISSTAKKNREILSTALKQAGFVNYPTEFWHWSYGDRYWAYMEKQPYALYGLVD